jgi:MFS transporter, DHA2 family, methylenomycin A resistance protein
MCSMSIEQHRAAIVVALVAAFMVFVDATIVNITLPQLTSHLHASRSELEWAVNAYTVSFAAVMLGAGAITDALGAKLAFQAGLLVFTASSTICALAGSMGVLDLARLAQGAGAALLLPSALVLATRSAPDENARHRLVGLWAAAGGAGMAAGPVLGGALTALASWRAVFAVNVIIGVPAGVWSGRSMPRAERRRVRLDISGMVAATALIGGLVFTLIQSPADGWDSSLVLAASGLALVGLVTFVLAERAAAAPILPPGVYRDPRFLGAVAQGALFNFAFYGLLFALSLMLQQGHGLGPLTSGLMVLPLTGVISIANLCAAPLARRFDRRVVLAGAEAGLTASLALLAWASTARLLWPLLLALIPTGLSSGLLVTTLTSEVIGAVEAGLHGAASAAFNAVRQVGGAVGVATLAPLLETAGSLGEGFTRCLLVGAAAAAAGLVIATYNRVRRFTALAGADP